jgi:hypothetical protein
LDPRGKDDVIREEIDTAAIWQIIATVTAYLWTLHITNVIKKMYVFGWEALNEGEKIPITLVSNPIT